MRRAATGGSKYNVQRMLLILVLRLEFGTKAKISSDVACRTAPRSTERLRSAWSRIVQKIDSAAMDIYALARVYSFDDGAQDLEDFSTIMIGSRIKF